MEKWNNTLGKKKALLLWPMNDFYGFGVSAAMFFKIMVSFGFFIGITLMISPEAFEALHKKLQKEYGLKIRLIPRIEDKYVDVIDRAIVKNRIIAGLIIAITSFILLLIYN